jgi:hypothetical protein
MLGRKAFAIHAFAAIAAIVACQNVLSIDGNVTVAPHVVDACGLSIPSGGCQACVASQCCGELRSCAGAADCAPYESCLLGCGGDYGCRARCADAHPIGATAEIPTLDHCVVTKCESACGVACGLPGSFVGGDAAVDCQSCIVAHGCSAGEECGANLDCQMITRCEATCVTPDCQWGCLEAHDAGVDIFSKVLLGVGLACGPACNQGGNWSCVGKVTWQFAKAPTSTLTMHLLDISSQKAIPRAQVRACLRDDLDCLSPVFTGTADDTGVIDVVVQRAPTGTGFQGYLEITASGYVPTLFFLAWPLAEPHSVINVLVAGQSNIQNSASLIGITLDPSRGQIGAQATDCFFLAAQNVQIAADNIDDQTTRVYSAGNALSKSATQTDTSGYAFFFNAPTRAVTLHVTPTATGVESSRVGAFVRAGAQSMLLLVPTPK